MERGLDWDDVLPDELWPIWTLHFKILKEIGNLKFHRPIIPDDAANLNIPSMETANGSNKIACAAIYIRFRDEVSNIHNRI